LAQPTPRADDSGLDVELGDSRNSPPQRLFSTEYLEAPIDEWRVAGAGKCCLVRKVKMQRVNSCAQQVVVSTS
jgi:hypothetical protein